MRVARDCRHPGDEECTLVRSSPNAIVRLVAPCARSFVAAWLAIGTVVSLAEADPPIPERRSTICDVCEDEAASFNIEISRREREAATVPDASQFRAKIARLGREVDACEATECPPIVAFPDVISAAKTSEPKSNPIGAEFGVSARFGPFSGMTDPAFPGNGYGAHAGIRLYGVYLGAAISSFPSANFCFWFPCSQPFRMLGGVVGYDFEPTRVLVLRPQHGARARLDRCRNAFGGGDPLTIVVHQARRPSIVAIASKTCSRFVRNAARRA